MNKEIEQKIDEILSKMTISEKIALGSGADFWHLKSDERYGIKQIMVCDGPHGLRKQVDATDMLGLNKSVPATCFPTASISGCSFDEDLLEEMGEAIGNEALANEVSVVLGPGANIKRNPLCGRNFEYFSEDPVLSGKMAAAEIRGIEKTGCGSSLKHFALNNQETMRFASDSIVDEKTMREIYLKSFEIAVKEGKPSTVMSSYNRINGIHSSDNKWLLTDVLRNQWGFNGMVMTDWGGMFNRMDGFKAGCDLTMPGGSAYMEKDCEKAIEEETLSIEDVERTCRNVLRLILTERPKVNADYQKHHQLAYKVAANSLVLLKNEERILPLDKEEKVLFVGDMVANMRYQGSGSSHINPTELHHCKEYLEGYDYIAGCDENGNVSEKNIKELARAKNYDKVVVFAGLINKDESEGFDRENMRISKGHLRMIDEICKYNQNVVVVLVCGSAVELPFEKQVKGLLYAGLSGQAGAKAIVDTLFGINNPSGHLAESWPVQYEDCVSSDDYGCKNPIYKEGIYVGYRYYQKANISVAFPFGHGLSYSQFELSNLSIHNKEVSVKITNTSEIAGKAVVQLYISAPHKDKYREVRSLKHFVKVYLAANESKEVSFVLNDEDFLIYQDGFKQIQGDYRIEVGFSCDDLRLSETIHLDGEEDAFDAPQWYCNPIGKANKEDYQKIYGKPIHEEKMIKGQYTMNNSVAELKDYSWIMKIMYKATEMVIAKGFGGKADYENPDFRMLMASAAGSSLNAMKISGGMNNYVLEGMLDIANGHFFKGILQMMKKERI